MSRPHEPRRPRAGFTLIEVMISVVVLGLLMGSVGLVGMSNRRAFEQGAASADLEVHVRRVADHVVRELMRTGPSSFDAPLPDGDWTDDLVYQKAVGISGGTTDWDGDVFYNLRWEYEVGEIDDGVDNNGNGLVDEGRVVWVRDLGKPSEEQVVLCRNVCEYLEGEVANGADDNDNGLEDERGFCLERDGDAIVVRISLATIVAESGLQTRTLETSVKLRN